MSSWRFLTNHGLAMLCIARQPGARLRDIAAELGVTERTAYGIVQDLVGSGYLKKEREGRRNRYRILGHRPLREPIGREGTVRKVTMGEVLGLFVEREPGSVRPSATGKKNAGAGRAGPASTAK